MPSVLSFDPHHNTILFYRHFYTGHFLQHPDNFVKIIILFHNLTTEGILFYFFIGQNTDISYQRCNCFIICSNYCFFEYKLPVFPSQIHTDIYFCNPSVPIAFTKQSLFFRFQPYSTFPTSDLTPPFRQRCRTCSSFSQEATLKFRSQYFHVYTVGSGHHKRDLCILRHFEISFSFQKYPAFLSGKIDRITQLGFRIQPHPAPIGQSVS